MAWGSEGDTSAAPMHVLPAPPSQDVLLVAGLGPAPSEWLRFRSNEGCDILVVTKRMRLPSCCCC